MELTKQLFAKYEEWPGDVSPLPFANIYSSDANGNFIADVFYTQSDENGYFVIPTDLPASFITFQYQGNKTTFTYNEVINASAINVLLLANELDEVIIYGDPIQNNNSLLYVLLGLLGLKIISQ